MGWSAQNAGWKWPRRGVLFGSLAMLLRPWLAAAAMEGNAMEQDFGKPNPQAPAALSRFGFLIGRWRCEAKLKLDGGTWQTFQAKWVGRYILDGYAIEDEYRMFDAAGKLIVLGMNVRSYDAAASVWNVRWLNALGGLWTNLVSEEMGGVRFDGQSVIYAFKEPVAAHAYTRATYTAHSTDHFTWRGEKSEDAKVWGEFMVVECLRSKS